MSPARSSWSQFSTTWPWRISWSRTIRDLCAPSRWRSWSEPAGSRLPNLAGRNRRHMRAPDFEGQRSCLAPDQSRRKSAQARLGHLRQRWYRPVQTGIRRGHMDVEEEAARGEIERLRGMAGLDLAVRIMKAWRQDPGATRSQAELAAWLLRDYPDAAGLLPL